ncbi:MAG: hypothetical protein H7A04_10395 [Pseudomonadales bacterium]|nr:hypothetical protein [Pseudomonadales bacterium]
MKYNLEYGYGLKALVERLFGRDAWLDVKHSTSVSKWRKYCNKILSAIQLAAKSNVLVSDDDWFDELDHIVEHGRKRLASSKTTEEMFAALASSLGEISFHQLGRCPNHSASKNVTLRHSSRWKLNQFRSVQYVQSKTQILFKQAHNNELKTGRGTARHAP